MTIKRELYTIQFNVLLQFYLRKIHKNILKVAKTALF